MKPVTKIKPSAKVYDRKKFKFKEIEDARWTSKADKTLKEGFHGVSDSAKIMNHLRYWRYLGDRSN